MPSGQYAVIVVVVALAVLAIARLELVCLRDLAQRRDTELNYLTRTGWTVVIACVIPIGGICYLYLGRAR